MKEIEVNTLEETKALAQRIADLLPASFAYNIER